MNRTKLLSIMPYILGILILVLVAVIILTGLGSEEGTNSTNPSPTPDVTVRNADKTEQNTKNDENAADSDNNDQNITDAPSEENDIEEQPVTQAPEPTATTAPEPTKAPTPTPVTDLTYGFKFESKADYVDTKDGVNLRLGCSTDTSKVAFLENGKRLERTGYNDEWTRVIYDGQECYIATRLIIRAVDSIDAVVEPETEDADDSGASGDAENATAGGDNNPVEGETPETTEDEDTPTDGKVSYYGAGAGKLVCIDPGHQSHGNSDTESVGPGSDEMKAKCSSGAEGVATGTEEYVLDLAVSLMLKEELEARGYKVVMTRTSNDVDISNVERAQIANNAGADVFIRIHADSSENSATNGLTTYNMTKNSPYNAQLYAQSRKLSECISECACNRTDANNRGTVDSNNYSGINWSAVPVSIVEMGFMSNPDEDRMMNTDSYRRKLAVGIADGLDKYFSGK